jgi:PleD family two-component response regulator
VTASFGVAGWQGNVPQGSTFDALVARCDEGVYASKAAGRNCVTPRPMD